MKCVISPRKSTFIILHGSCSFLVFKSSPVYTSRLSFAWYINESHNALLHVNKCSLFFSLICFALMFEDFPYFNYFTYHFDIAWLIIKTIKLMSFHYLLLYCIFRTIHLKGNEFETSEIHSVFYTYWRYM